MSFPRVNGYDIRDKIGDGGFSKVYRAIKYATHLVAACKVVPITKESWTENIKKELYKEIKVHTQLKHAHILEFLYSETYEDSPETAERGVIPAVYMLLEFASGGDLFDKIVPDQGVSEVLAHLYFQQMISGVEFIHNKGVCHRDLKPENLMLTLSGGLKICDFGLCAVFKHKGMERVLTERCGSLPYVAPELNGSQGYRAEPIDVWGCGVILFTMLVGNTPWDEPTEASPEYVAFVQGRIFSTSPWNKLQGNLLGLLIHILQPDPSKRITIPEILENQWFKQHNPLIEGGEAALADALAGPLQQNGFLDLANPMGAPSMAPDQADDDGDIRMVTNAGASQFTQALMLFSQTQGGTRYTPDQSRFYTTHGCYPEQFLSLAVPVLQNLGLKCRQPDVKTRVDPTNDTSAIRKCVMRIGGMDARNLPFKGSLEIDTFREGSFVILMRDTGEPLAWKRIWMNLTRAPSIQPYLLTRSKATSPS